MKIVPFYVLCADWIIILTFKFLLGCEAINCKLSLPNACSFLCVGNTRKINVHTHVILYWHTWLFRWRNKAIELNDTLDSLW